MLEWYRAEAPYGALMDDCAAILRVAAQAAGIGAIFVSAAELDPFAAPEMLTVAEAFQRFAGIDLLGAARRPRRARARRRRGSACGSAPDDTGPISSARSLSRTIEPRLGHGRATMLIDYPAPEAALARRKPADPRFAERFELYGCGVELANGFGELTDAVEQRRRFEADMAERRRIYGDAYPIDEDFLAALACMPPASGIALGFDRLVMLATGAAHIEQVLWAPVGDAMNRSLRRTRP